MVHPTRLILCPNARACPDGDECDMVHTMSEAEAHPIALLRQLRSYQKTGNRPGAFEAGALGRAEMGGVLAACHFAAQLGLKRLGDDGSVFVTGALAADVRMKALRFVINARNPPAAPPELSLPLQTPRVRSVAVVAGVDHRHLSPPSSGGRLAEVAPPADEDTQQRDAVQRELARRLCLHVRRLFPARLASGSAPRAVRLGSDGVPLLPISALPASFLDEQQGVVTSLTFAARGLGWPKFSQFLRSPLLACCCELRQDPHLNQTYISSTHHRAGRCGCCAAPAMDEMTFRDAIRHFEQRGQLLSQEPNATYASVTAGASSAGRVEQTPSPPPARAPADTAALRRPPSHARRPLFPWLLTSDVAQEPLPQAELSARRASNEDWVSEDASLPFTPPYTPLDALFGGLNCWSDFGVSQPRLSACAALTCGRDNEPQLPRLPHRLID